MLVPVGGRLMARDTWHVPPCKGLQKNSHAPTGQTEGTADPKLAGRTCYHPNLSAFGVAVPERRRLHALGEESFFDMGSSGFRKL